VIRNEEVIGKQFGRLTVLRRNPDKLEFSHGKTKYDKPTFRTGYWICQCSCGNVRSNRLRDLVNNRVVSCGCYQKERIRRNTEHCATLDPKRKRAHKSTARPKGQWKKRTYNHLTTLKNSIYRVYLYGAKTRGYEFDIPFDLFFQLVQLPCHYCAKVESNKYTHKQTGLEFRYNGLDRKDNAKGYALENIVPCCRLCNRTKGPLDEADFINLCRTIVTEHSTPLPEVLCD
jgi:hypothetical protein